MFDVVRRVERDSAKYCKKTWLHGAESCKRYVDGRLKTSNARTLDWLSAVYFGVVTFSTAARASLPGCISLSLWGLRYSFQSCPVAPVNLLTC